eukprot:2766544-Prymnesium_polylepis.1
MPAPNSSPHVSNTDSCSASLKRGAAPSSPVGRPFWEPPFCSGDARGGVELEGAEESSCCGVGCCERISSRRLTTSTKEAVVDLSVCFTCRGREREGGERGGGRRARRERVALADVRGCAARYEAVAARYAGWPRGVRGWPYGGRAVQEGRMPAVWACGRYGRAGGMGVRREGGARSAAANSRRVAARRRWSCTCHARRGSSGARSAGTAAARQRNGRSGRRSLGRAAGSLGA